MKREFPAAIEFLNGLAASPTPFLQQHALPELTAIRSHLYLMCRQMERSEELADSFCLLPPIADKERFMKYHEMAATTYYFTQKVKKAIHLQEQAVEASRQGGNSKNMGRMLAWLAFITTWRETMKMPCASTKRHWSFTNTTPKTAAP